MTEQHRITKPPTCPRCGQECYRDEVDVEVGILYGPWGCFCGWSEDAEYDVSDGRKQTAEGYEIDQWGGLTPPSGGASRIRPAREGNPDV